MIQAYQLDREDGEVVYGDSGYAGATKRIEFRKDEHPYLIVKNQIGYRKTVYHGIKKNLNRFYMLFASANLVMCYRAGRAKDFCKA